MYAEINLNAISHNVRELRRLTHPKARLMAVVKADAYGHGAVRISQQALQNGAELLGVARIREGIHLREAGFDVPILIFGYTPPDLGKKLIEFSLTQSVYSYKSAELLSDIASSSGHKIKIHIKTDTGMGRVGLLLTNPHSSPIHEVESIAKLPGIELEGIFTHFAKSDYSDKSFTKRQLEIFTDFIYKLRIRGIDIPIKHAANSAAIIEMPETHLDMVRAGISLYGLYPSEEVDKNLIALKPAMELKSKVVYLKKVPAGFRVSYGCTYETGKPSVIATVDIGYADGLNRRLSSHGYMLVHGYRSPIVGRICMDLTMLDVGHIPDVCIGDEAVIFGRQGDSEITVDEIASMLDTINYEVVSGIADRVPRIYKQ